MTHPAVIGKYPIARVLGTGGMGVVYEAFDLDINRPVAIKTIHMALIGQDLSGMPTTERFRNEARAVGRLSHPNIVAIYEYGEDQDAAYIAMEYVEGRTLSEILHATPRLPECDVLTLMDQLLGALDYAHLHGVWHRDIKPANLIVTNAGLLKVTDFGIARIESLMHTKITATLGTPGYMAPEQYAGGKLDHRVDIFASGALLYFLLVGRPPFEGTSAEVMHKVLNDQAVPPSGVAECARSEFYDDIVAKALAKNAADRYPSAAAFRQALAERKLAAPRNTGETTAIVVSGNARTTPAVGVSESSGRTPPAVATPTPTPIPGWDPATLLRVEAALAHLVGPIARIMVRQAAKLHPDLAGLASAIDEQLPSDADRARFHARLGGTTGGAKVAAAAQPHTPGSNPAGQAKGRPMSPEIVAAALRVLTKRIGPVASVLVKRSAAKAQTMEQFHVLLADLAAEGDEREQLLTELRKGL